MKTLISTEIKNQIESEISVTQYSITILTAFCTKKAIEFIENQLPKNIQKKRILVRMNMTDVISGATDLEIFPYCKGKGWDVYIRFDMHAKIYIFDNKRCVLGSANLTGKGLVDNEGNCEIAAAYNMDNEDIRKIDSIFNDAILMNDEIYDLMLQEIKHFPDKSHVSCTWSDNIKSRMHPECRVLFTSDFPQYSDYRKYYGREIEFLNLSSDWGIEDLKTEFTNSKPFLWLRNLVHNNGNEMYFGTITASLHKALINEPAPYRKEIKVLLSNLLQWIQDLEIHDFIIDRPNHSQRVKIS